MPGLSSENCHARQFGHWQACPGSLRPYSYSQRHATDLNTKSRHRRSSALVEVVQGTAGVQVVEEIGFAPPPLLWLLLTQALAMQLCLSYALTQDRAASNL